MTSHKSTFLRRMSHYGYFRLWGKDAAALLHHLTTNDITALQSGQCCEAVLVNGKARCLDIVIVAKMADHFLVVTSPNRRAMFAPHANSFIVFRQDVTIEDAASTIHALGVFGAESEQILSDKLPLNSSLPPGKIISAEVNNDTVSALQTSRLPGNGYLLLSSAEATLSKLEETLDLPYCDNATFNKLRVEAGMPIAGLEITEDYNPWEINCDQMISLHKGCYNGQEVIARLNTYEKVKQHLRGLKLAGAVNTNTPLKLQYDGKTAGKLTSAVSSSRFGPIALGFVRKKYEEAGTELKVLLDEKEVDATVVDLPFGM